MTNEISIKGFVRYAPEMRYTSDGVALTTFNIYDTDHGLYDSKWRIVVWDLLAEKCNQQIYENSRVFIKGYAKTNIWTDKDGNIRETINIVAKRVWELDGSETEMNTAKEITINENHA